MDKTKSLFELIDEYEARRQLDKELDELERELDEREADEREGVNNKRQRSLFDDNPPRAAHVLRKTYKLKRWSQWDDEIHQAVQDFHGRFDLYPNILLANQVTLQRIDMASKNEHKRDNTGNAPEEDAHASITSFTGAGYEFFFALEEKLADKAFVLIYDSEPDGDGEPLPEDNEDKISHIAI